MTKKIDETQFLRDFREGKNYVGIALRQKITIGTVAYWVKKLGLKRSGQRGQKKESFSAEEKYIISKMIETHRGREQLLYILRGEQRKGGKKMYSKYRCLNCGRIWRSGDILVICPICRSKPIKIKEGVNVEETVKRLKGVGAYENRLFKD